MRVVCPGDTHGVPDKQVGPYGNSSFKFPLASENENGNQSPDSTADSFYYASTNKLIHSAFNHEEENSITNYEASINKELQLHKNYNISEGIAHHGNLHSKMMTNTYRGFDDISLVNKTFSNEHYEGRENIENNKLVMEKEASEPLVLHLLEDWKDNLNSSNKSPDLDQVNERYQKKNEFRNSKGILELTYSSLAFGKNCENQDAIDPSENGSLKGVERCDNGVNSNDYFTKRPHFSHGIINPNYPGFQHLAHTLADHFVIHPSHETYDSDLSECEMELSADSFDDIQEYESNVTDEKNDNAQESLPFNGSIDEIGKFDETDETMNIATCVMKSGVTNLYTEDSNTNVINGPVASSHDLPSCLKTFLQLDDFHQNRNGAKLDGNNKISNTKVTVASAENNGAMFYTCCADDESKNGCCPTPDILKKNGNLENGNVFKIQYRPDLLQNVGANSSDVESKNNFEITTEKNRIDDDNSNKIAYQKPFEIQDSKHVLLDQKIVADEVTNGTTPVDIIGDFEQEVVREFGLLVNGYSKSTDGRLAMHMPYSCPVSSSEKMADAALSNAVEQIKSSVYIKNNEGQTLHDMETEIDKNIDCSKVPTYILRPTTSHSKHTKSLDVRNQTNTKPNGTQHFFNAFEDNDADWFECENTVHLSDLNSEEESNDRACTSNLKNDLVNVKPKYKKHSYDDRQLPPVAVDYKCSLVRMTRKSQNSQKHVKGVKAKATRNSCEASVPQKRLNSKSCASSGYLQTGANRRSEGNEIQQYQQLISTDKELILSKSRYSKMSCWAQHLKNSVKERSNKKLTGLHQSKFSWSAHETGSREVDMLAIQNHIEAANEYEKKRRFDRDEIRKRLAMGFCADSTNNSCSRSMQNGKSFPRILMNDVSSDNESHSSDSETCPKLSKLAEKKFPGFANVFATDSIIDVPYIRQSLSVNNVDPNVITLSTEDKECDFFTKQARLQIEARMALAQAKNMAHIQMEIDRQKLLTSPITEIIRGSLEKVGIQMSTEKRRVSRQMLTDMNIAQLQIIVNDLHTHIENLNESLVHYLIDRDELHMGQDSMLFDIEDLTRYLGAKERSNGTEREKLISKGKQ